MARFRPRISPDAGRNTRQFVLQKLLIEKHFPCFKCTLTHRTLKCEGLIRPSEGCPKYRLSISYKQGGTPSVRVLEPEIKPSSAIHVYPDGHLCLYYPAESPWRPAMNIHETIIPWAAEWLVFYELFLVCGTWLGPEADHRLTEED